MTCPRPQRTATRLRLEPVTSRFKVLGYTTAPVRSTIKLETIISYCVRSGFSQWYHWKGYQFNRRRGGLVVRASDSGARGRGFDPHSGRRVVSLSKIFLPPKKLLVIPRKTWLRPDMTEKLLIGT